jgi:transposase
MSQEQLQRIKVIENAVAGRITVREAAEYLNLSERQVQRLKGMHSAEDASWVYHGNQGRDPHNALSSETRQKIEELARAKYAGFNDTHLHEKLTKVEGFIMSRPTVQRILREAGLSSPQKRRPPKYRSRRERREQEGMLLQVDGSRHDWLEGRGPLMTLLGLVDDATNKVPAAHFQLEHEDSAGYLRLFRSQVESHGIPWAIYRDQHSTLQRNDSHWSVAEQLEGRQFPTQVGRALEELGMETIVARSPQAKGRIERTWRTFQDRLISELRLARTATLDQANAVLSQFLTDYNTAFAKTPSRAGSAYRKLDVRLDLNYILSLRYQPTVGNDHIVTPIPGLQVQLPALANGRGYAGKKVDACQQPNGDFHFYLNHRLLHIEVAAADAGPVRAHRFRQTKSPLKKKPVQIYSFAGHPALRP